MSDGLKMYETHVTQHQQTEYQPSLWAVLLHQLPHVNITFHRLEDERFRPDSELYLESLGIIGSVPAAILILTLIILLIYLLTRCCDTKNNKVRYDSHYIHKHLQQFMFNRITTRKISFYRNANLDRLGVASPSSPWSAAQHSGSASTATTSSTPAWRGSPSPWCIWTGSSSQHKNRCVVECCPISMHYRLSFLTGQII